jgi:hypothetical protein
MNKSDADEADFYLLTMVDTGGAWRNQASNISRDGIIFDALVLFQTNSTFYKVITKHKIASRQLCEVHSEVFYVPLTGQRCNRSER